MNCQICGMEIKLDKAGIFKKMNDGIVHLACLHKAEERAEREAKSVIRGEQEGGGGE